MSLPASSPMTSTSAQPSMLSPPLGVGVGVTVPAPPPSRSEVERKLSFKSAASPRLDAPSKRVRSASQAGTDSDSSNAPLSPVLSPQYPTNPHLPHLSPNPISPHPLTPGGVGAGAGSGAGVSRSLSAIAERKSPGGGASEELEDYAEEGVDEDGDGEGSGSEEEGVNVKVGKELQRGMEGERMLKSGYLFKKQEKRKVWKKKWFVLRTGKLAYYKDDREYSLSRVIDLHHVHTVAPVTVKKHPFTFGIVTSKRTFLAKASSQSEMDDWVNSLNVARRKLSGDDKPTTGPLPTAAASPSIAIPPRQDGAVPETHQGTYTSTFSTTTGGSISASPVTTTGYFAPRAPNLAVPSAPGATLPPGQSSPMDTSNSLTSQFAKISAGGWVMPSQPVGAISPTQPLPPRTASARREPSASSISSSTDYFPRGVTAVSGSGPLSPNPGALPAVSSDEEEGEPYFSDPAQAFAAHAPAPGASPQTMQIQPSMPPGAVDPARIILAAYLMKRSKGRGRKVWRKRWFYLTSQGLTYTKSHMDSRPLRFIHLSSILDALDLSSSLASTSESDSDAPGTGPGPFRQPSARGSRPIPGRTPSLRHASNPPPSASASASTSAAVPIPGGARPERSPPQRQLSNSLGILNDLNPGRRRDKERERDRAGPSGPAGGEGQNTFRLVTAKRTYVLCAPTEEDEIKWLAAFRALLQRERQATQPGTTTGLPVDAVAAQSPTTESAPRLPMPPHVLPTITAQPPTPAASTDGVGPTPAQTTTSGPPVEVGRSEQSQSTSTNRGGAAGGAGSDGTTTPGSLGGRGRSATYTAKSAVEEVTRRFHPETGDGSIA
ncbi:hypothetical protein JCM24511_03132 [Saitozyma sp. JCM 24511]|nr:hypothetical protein JCM24511_03132 [Saitozyma sp. JCM 24511]